MLHVSHGTAHGSSMLNIAAKMQPTKHPYAANAKLLL
jgi:hypothetical protein